MQSVEWGEFRYDYIYDLQETKNKLSKKDCTTNGVIPVFSSDSNNNGIIGYVNTDPTYIVEKENYWVVFGDHTRTFNLINSNFCITDNVKVLKPIKKVSRSILLFINACWQKQIPSKGYSRHWSIAKNIKIQLPICKKGEIDFSFMENFIAELEAQRIAELEAHLTVAGLKNYTLTTEEQQVLSLLKNNKIEWKEYKIGELFDRVKTKKLPYKANDLPKEPIGKNILPALTSSFQNQGLNYYVPKEGATILNNVISIPSNSDVYRAYYQSNDFTVLSDAYAIEWIKDRLSSKSYLFMVSCINKRIDLPIYSYKNKLGGWNVVKNKLILLPVKNGKIDFAFMELLISAIQKVVIKDVVLYADRKIEATKKVVNK